MTPVSGIILFALIWWMAFFCVLPLNIRPGAPVRGEMPGAPADPGIGRKAIYATLAACVVWLIAYALVTSDLVSFRRIAMGMRM